MYRQVLEMPDDQVVISDLQRHLPHGRMWKCEELVQQSKLVHHFKSRGMDGIAAEITQEVRVLFQHKHVASCPREQQAGHHSSGSAADHDQVMI